MKKLIIIFVLFLLILISSCSEDNYNEKFNKVKVGMTPIEVQEIMGKPQYEENRIELLVCYWYDGASDIKDAEEKRSKGIFVKYYCCIFIDENDSGLMIQSKDDIFKGNWGEE